jgi:hypothetical protein
VSIASFLDRGYRAVFLVWYSLACFALGFIAGAMLCLYAGGRP